MTQINLLPWREQSRKLKQNRFGLIALAAAAMGLFFTLVFHMDYSLRISEQGKRNAILQAALDEESTHLKNLNKDKKELINVDNQLHFIYSLRNTGYQAIQLLNKLAMLNPDSITLNKIVRNGNAILISGKVKSNVQITLFMQSIEKSKVFNQPILTEISGKESETGEVRSFQLKLQQVE